MKLLYDTTDIKCFNLCETESRDRNERVHKITHFSCERFLCVSKSYALYSFGSKTVPYVWFGVLNAWFRIFGSIINGSKTVLYVWFWNAKISRTGKAYYFMDHIVCMRNHFWFTSPPSSWITRSSLFHSVFHVPLFDTRNRWDFGFSEQNLPG